MSVNPDYHVQDGPNLTSREHQLFAAALANTKLDPEIGFLCGADELGVLFHLSVDMATHSPRGECWEDLGYWVFTIIEAQRRGEVDAEMIERYYEVRATMTGTGLPPEPLGGYVSVSEDVVWSDEQVAPLPVCPGCCEPMVPGVAHTGCAAKA